MKKQSIKFIAQSLNVSISTVSAVLNGKSEERRISKQMTEKIESHLKEIQFQPNNTARNLRIGKSNTLGVILENIADPFFALIARNLEIKANEYGYSIFFASSENNKEIASKLLQSFKYQNVNSFIVAPPLGIEDELQTLVNEGETVIIYDRDLPTVNSYKVLVDNFNGVYMAVDHLLKKGRKDIGLVTLDSQQTQMRDRLDGFKKAMKDNKLKPKILKLPYEKNMDLIKPKLLHFLSKNPQIDGLIFTTNYITSNGLFALKTIGKSIPNDIAVVGYDDNSNFKLYTPTITAVQQPIEAACEKIMEIVRLKSQKKEADPITYYPTKLIERESTK